MNTRETMETGKEQARGPSRQSIDLRRAHLREVDMLPAGGPGVDEIVADKIDGDTAEAARTAEIRNFIQACPERLRKALEAALSTPGRIMKKDIAKAAGISRPTLNDWLEKASEAVWGASRPPFGRIAV